mgnify:FL=1
MASPTHPYFVSSRLLCVLEVYFCTTRLLRMFVGVGPLHPQVVAHVKSFWSCTRTLEGGRSTVSTHFPSSGVVAEIYIWKGDPQGLHFWFGNRFFHVMHVWCAPCAQNREGGFCAPVCQETCMVCSLIVCACPGVDSDWSMGMMRGCVGVLCINPQIRLHVPQNG